jgi:hypothetical protein
MFSRILLPAVAAGALLAAAPALAAESADARAAAECCCPPGHMHHGQGERPRAEQREEPRRDAPQQRAEPESPYERNESYGG